MVETPLDLFVVGDDHGDVSLEIVKKNVAAALMVDDESEAVKRLDELAAGEGPAQMATSTSRTVNSGHALISLSFSSPSI